jgi:hypothetical protein
VKKRHPNLDFDVRVEAAASGRTGGLVMTGIGASFPFALARAEVG